MSQSGEAAYEMSGAATSGNSVLASLSSSLGKEVKKELGGGGGVGGWGGGCF